MKGSSFTMGLRLVSKCTEQAEGRILEAIRLPRWATRYDVALALRRAGLMQWKMERIRAAAEREFILYAAEPGTF